MILNICIKFQEDIFNGFHVKHSHDFVKELPITNFKGMKLKKCIFKSFDSCTLLVLNIFMKFYEYILDSSKVIERTRFCQETAT